MKDIGTIHVKRSFRFSVVPKDKVTDSRVVARLINKGGSRRLLNKRDQPGHPEVQPGRLGPAGTPRYLMCMLNAVGVCV